MTIDAAPRRALIEMALASGLGLLIAAGGISGYALAGRDRLFLALFFIGILVGVAGQVRFIRSVAGGRHETQV